MFKTLKEKIKENRARLYLAAVSVLSLVASASAIDFTSITDLIDEIVLIFPSMVAMVVAAIPIIVVISLIAFIVGFLDGIISKIR